MVQLQKGISKQSKLRFSCISFLLLCFWHFTCHFSQCRKRARVVGTSIKLFRCDLPFLASLSLQRSPNCGLHHIMIPLWCSISGISISTMIKEPELWAPAGPPPQEHFAPPLSRKTSQVFLKYENIQNFSGFLFNIWLQWSATTTISISPDSEVGDTGVAKSSLSASYHSAKGDNHWLSTNNLKLKNIDLCLILGWMGQARRLRVLQFEPLSRTNTTDPIQSTQESTRPRPAAHSPSEAKPKTVGDSAKVPGAQSRTLRGSRVKAWSTSGGSRYSSKTAQLCRPLEECWGGGELLSLKIVWLN